MSSLVVREFRAYIVCFGSNLNPPKRRDRVPGVVFFLPGCLSKKIKKTIKIFRVLEKAHVFV